MLQGGAAIGLEQPIFDGRWSLEPQISWGFAVSNKIESIGHIAAATLTSRYRIDGIGRGYFIIGNMIGYTETLSTAMFGAELNPHLRNWVFRNGVAYELPLNFMVMGRGASVRASYEITNFTGDPLFLNQFQEAALSFGVRSREGVLHNSYEALRLGITALWGRWIGQDAPSSVGSAGREDDDMRSDQTLFRWRRDPMFSRLLLWLPVLVVLLCGLGAPAWAGAKEARLALVIANGQYQGLPVLEDTYSDGDRIAAALTAANFADASGSGPVQVRKDLTAAQLTSELIAFRDRLKAAGPDSFGIVYYSGHGAALGSYGDTALLAIDQSVDQPGDLVTRAKIADLLLSSNARTVIVVSGHVPKRRCRPRQERDRRRADRRARSPRRLVSP